MPHPSQSPSYIINEMLITADLLSLKILLASMLYY